MNDDTTSFFEGLVKDGRPLLSWTALALFFSGSFALYVSFVGQFLPHDIHFLGSSAQELRSIADGRLANFMFHDRVAFGGSLIAIALLYLWLAEFPLARGEAWAWWSFVVSGVVGFGSFLGYLGYGYLDTWHGVATLALVPVFAVGVIRARSCLREPRSLAASLMPARNAPWKSSAGVGRAILLATGLGMILAGGTIMLVGMTMVFVPQDLDYMGLAAHDLAEFNPRLIPLIAHDRAGFGGGLGACGLLVFAVVWRGRTSKSLLQVLSLSGFFGFGTAIGVHFAIGYTDFLHLAPAYAGFFMYAAGLTLWSTDQPIDASTEPPIHSGSS